MILMCPTLLVAFSFFDVRTYVTLLFCTDDTDDFVFCYCCMHCYCYCVLVLLFTVYFNVLLVLLLLCTVYCSMIQCATVLLMT
jgi:hypothetical protein